MPTVLLITFYYPPGHHVGSERMVKFEKYLPAFGFRTCVLTAGKNSHQISGRPRRIYRAFEPGQFYRLIVERLFLRRSPFPQGEFLAESPAPFMKKFTGKSLSGLRELADRIAIPDLQIGWLPSALWAGFKAIKREQVDVILSSSRPETPHLVAAILSNMTGVPWVADFRDGWLFEPLKPFLRRRNLRRRIEQNLERMVVTKAGAVVSVSQPITEYFCVTYPEFKRKFETIPNGYDPDDWRNIPVRASNPEKFRFVYTGRLAKSSPLRNNRSFLQAIHNLPETLKSKMEVLWVGELAENERALLVLANSDGIMRLIGQVDKEESLAYQTSADCLLLFVGKEKSVITSKLFEYLYTRRPILAIAAPDTAAASIIRQTKAGEVVDPDDPKAISDCIIRLFRRWQSRDLDYPVRGIECYERRELTRKMAEVLKSVIS